MTVTTHQAAGSNIIHPTSTQTPRQQHPTPTPRRHQGMEEAAAHDNPACPRCKQAAFSFEDVGEGEQLVCTECGLVVDEVQLVHTTTMREGGAVQQTGVYVAAHDDGRRAGAVPIHAAGGGGGGGSTARTLAVSRERLEAGVSYLQLPQHVAAAARQLLPRVVDANRGSSPRRNTTATSVAATIYMAARESSYALPLGAAGSALAVNPVLIGKEFRRLVELLQLPMPPPSLEALLMRGAATVLPRFQASTTGSLRQQPVVRKALDLARLLQAVAATDGRSPAVAAAAILSMCLAEEFRDAQSSAYAAQVATLLQHDRSAVQRHISQFEAALAPLLPLLPFAGPGGAGAGTDCVKYAGMLLRLQQLSQSAR